MAKLKEYFKIIKKIRQNKNIKKRMNLKKNKKRESNNFCEKLLRIVIL